MKNYITRRNICILILCVSIAYCIISVVRCNSSGKTMEEAFYRYFGADLVIGTVDLGNNTYVVGKKDSTYIAAEILFSKAGYRVSKYYYTDENYYYNGDDMVCVKVIRVSNNIDDTEIIVVMKIKDGSVPYDTASTEFACKTQTIGSGHTEIVTYYYYGVADIDAPNYEILP